MKKFILLISCFILSYVAFANDPMPEEIAKSLLLFREGILENNNPTVSDVFLNKKFKTFKLVDGTTSTVEYGQSKLDGNVYTLVINLLTNDKPVAMFKYVFVYQGSTTFFRSAGATDLATGKSDEFTDLKYKFEYLRIFNELKEK